MTEAPHAMNSPMPKGSLLRTVKAVGWAFLGIRKNSASQEDMGKLHPFHVIAVALLATAAFVGGLVALVHWVVAK